MKSSGLLGSTSLQTAKSQPGEVLQGTQSALWPVSAPGTHQGLGCYNRPEARARGKLRPPHKKQVFCFLSLRTPRQQRIGVLLRPPAARRAANQTTQQNWPRHSEEHDRNSQVGNKGTLRLDEISWQWIQTAQHSGLFQQHLAACNWQQWRRQPVRATLGQLRGRVQRTKSAETLGVSHKCAIKMPRSAPRTG